MYGGSTDHFQKGDGDFEIVGIAGSEKQAIVFLADQRKKAMDNL